MQTCDIVGRRVLTTPISYFMKSLMYYLPPHLFQILSNLGGGGGYCHQPPPPLLFLLSCFFDRMGDCATFDVLLCQMILWIHTCQTLVPQYQKDLDVSFMQQSIEFTEVWHTWFFAGTLIWYHTHKHTHTQKAHSGASKTDTPI